MNCNLLFIIFSSKVFSPKKVTVSTINSSFFSSRLFYNIKRWLVLVLFISTLVKGIQWWEGRGEGFRIYKIQDEVPYEARWDVAYSDKDLETAKSVLNQKFYYLGHGFQCYAFESEDRQYVIKFFRYQRLRLPNIIASIPDVPVFSEWRKGRIASLNRRKEYLLRSFKTSWDYAKDETAMLFMHLNKSKGLFQTITIVDLLGNEHLIDLDNYQFMLQKKAMHIKPTISQLVAAGKVDEAAKRLDQIFQLLLHCSKRGIQDTDGALIRKNNLGFLGNQAIYIDGGKLVFKAELRTLKSFEKDLERLKPLLSWLKKEQPLLVQAYHDSHKKAVEEYGRFLEAQ